MKTILVFIFLQIPLMTFSQEYLFIDREEIKSLFDTTVIIRDSIDFLFITLPEESGEGKIEAIYHFNKELICDSIEYRYYCNECLEEYIGELLSDRSHQWREISPNHYLSKKKDFFEIWLAPSQNKIGSIALKIQKTPGKKYCAIATYRLFITDAKSWKKLTKRKK